MSDNIYVYSTLTNDQLYVRWSKPGENGIAHREHEVFIKGGSNMSSGSYPHFLTPHGVSTKINQEDYMMLTGGVVDPKDPSFLTTGDLDFKRQMKLGFVQVRPDKVDPEVAAAAGMQYADGSAPLTPNSPIFTGENTPRLADDAQPTMAQRLKSLVGG